MNALPIIFPFRIFPSSFFHLVRKMIETIFYLLDILALNETNHEGEVYTNHGIMKRTVYYIRTSLPN